MNLESILIERIHVKFVKYNGILDKKRNILEVPITFNFNFIVKVADSKIEISLGTMTHDYHGRRKINSIINTIIINFEPGRPTFDPELIIKDVVEMFESMRLLINKFYKHSKKINKHCGNIPIHGRH